MDGLGALGGWLGDERDGDGRSRQRDDGADHQLSQ
jgi:hypothetical protein